MLGSMAVAPRARSALGFARPECVACQPVCVGFPALSSHHPARYNPQEMSRVAPYAPRLSSTMFYRSSLRDETIKRYSFR